MIDLESIEIQYNSNKSLELSYRLNSKVGENLFIEACNRSQEFIIDKEKIELISYAPSDDTTVINSAIALVYNEPYSKRHSLCNYHVRKLDPSGSILIKEYDSDFWRHPNIQLPKYARLAQQFGLGHYPHNNSIDFYDMYFFSESLIEVQQHYGLQLILPNEVSSQKLGLYGITYDSNLKPLKLKRYYYPNDPNLELPEKL